MHPFFIYLIQVNIALALFYILYKTMLGKDTFLHVRRFFFLSIILFSLLYPLFPVRALGDLWVFPWGNAREVNTFTTGILIGGLDMEVMIENEATRTASSIWWVTLLSWIYAVITAVFMLRFLFQLISIWRIWLKSEKQIVSGSRVYQLREAIGPFSFFNLIFIHAEQYSEAELNQILLHELTHAKEGHSIDVVLAELLVVFCWWNPFVWLMKREIAINLEYLADNSVIQEGVDTRTYQYHLLRLTYQGSVVSIVNKFSVSRLKQRVMMMNRTKSPVTTLAKYLLMLPLVFLLVVVNSCTNQTKETNPVQAPPPPPPSPELTAEEIAKEIFVVVEEQPEFPGGNREMINFLSDNIVYPKEAHEKGIQGRVICNFVVMKDGSIDSVNIVRGIDPLLDAEAVRVLESMPKWKPGKQRGQEVNVRFTLPVNFRINEPASTTK